MATTVTLKPNAIDISGSTSGTTTLQASAVAGTTTVTMPAATGIMMVSGNMPAFSARNSSSQSISSGTFTKVTLDTEDFDTNNNFASSTFTPTVAGYYQINCIVRVSGTAVTGSTIVIYKNGSAFTRVAETNSSIGSDFTLSGSSIVSCNGTTDTIEMYANITATSPNFNFANATACCRMSGSLVRGA